MCQGQYDDDQYRAEKYILLDAEVYRASGTLDPAGVSEMREWLAARPGVGRVTPRKNVWSLSQL